MSVVLLPLLEWGTVPNSELSSVSCLHDCLGDPGGRCIRALLSQPAYCPSVLQAGNFCAVSDHLIFDEIQCKLPKSVPLSRKCSWSCLSILTRIPGAAPIPHFRLDQCQPVQSYVAPFSVPEMKGHRAGA